MDSQPHRRMMARLSSRKTLSKSLILLLFPVLLLGTLYMFREHELAAIGNFLVVRDKLEPADIIFLLNGDPTVRPGHAAVLLQQGLASKIVIARAEDSEGVQFGAYPNVTDTNITMLKQLGVPRGEHRATEAAGWCPTYER